MNLESVAKQIIDNNYIAGVRSINDDEQYNVGDYCRQSYEWDIENDCSTYYTTGELANGTCATIIDTDTTDEEELVKNINHALESNSYYGGTQIIVVSKQVNNDGLFDPEEIRLVDAKVIGVINA